MYIYTGISMSVVYNLYTGNSVQACECLDEAKIKKSKQQKRPQRENLKECEDLKLICPQVITVVYSQSLHV